MRPFRLLGGSLLVLAWAIAAAAAPSSNASGGTPKARVFIGGVPDTGQFLPDSTVLAHVGPRVITVHDYRDGFFAIYPDMRPRPDSLGRLEFFGNLLRAHVLGLTANALGRPLSFEDRTTVTDYERRLLSNLLYMRSVQDSVDVSEQALRRVYAYYAYDLKFRHLFFMDHEEANHVRLELLRGQMSWSAAAARYARPGPDGRPAPVELDWLHFENVPPDIGLAIWPLRVGEFSPLVTTTSGYHLVQVAASRPRESSFTYEGLRPAIRTVLRNVETQAFRDRMQAVALQGLDVRMDTSFTKWASRKFGETMKVDNQGFSTEFSFDARLPEFTPDEMLKTVARWNHSRDSLQLKQVLQAYSDLPLMGRPTINTPASFEDYCMGIILEPRMVEIAQARGFYKDPFIVQQVARKEEEMRVTHMVEDSVFSHVSVTDQDRKKWYDDHVKEYVTLPSVKYAVALASSKAQADSIAARLRATTDPTSVVQQLQTRFGISAAKLDEERESPPGPWHKVLFEELRPGETTVNGPDAGRHWYAIRSIERLESRQLAFKEVEQLVDESVQNTFAQRALEVFVDRLKSRYRIDAHPELLQHVLLTDPAMDNE